MMHRISLVLCLWAACGVASPSFARGDDRPNFLVVLCDDLGYGDLACFGNTELITPNIDRFASQGLKLTDCYAASANCSPARTGLMTGRTPYRVGIHNWIPMFSPMHVKSSEITIATLLQRAGYQTCHCGKWHLNGRFNMEGQPQPNDHGFGYWFSTQNNCLPDHRYPDNFVRNGTPVGEIRDYASNIVAGEAIHWLKEVRKSGSPFFLYVCFHEPHEPIATDKQYRELYPSNDPAYSRHHGNITQMDHAFGNLMETIDDLNLAGNTFVLFTSDNGPAITRAHPFGSSGGLRDKKGAMYEGGIRVPGMIRWPGHTKPGTESAEPVCGVDLLPTLCEIAGIEPPRDRAIDGTSILPIFAGKPIRRKTPLYWQFNRAHTAVKVTMRDGDWKLLATLTGPDWKQGGEIHVADEKAMKVAELDRFELYNLKYDRDETRDVSAAHPEVVNRMKTRLKAIYTEVRDESPIWPEWEFARYEGMRIREGKAKRKAEGWDDY